MKQKTFAGRTIECFVFVMFLLGICIIGSFHEPWYDEALSWQIAKSASLRDILITLPPYEGHPPLWDLILAIPARIGVPFEVGLKAIGYLFSIASTALLLFRSKLPRAARLLLPFTYFFFYQYGVIVRPYSLMLLSLLLLGKNLPNRVEHPWRVVLLLMLLCGTNAYGILIAGGIAMGITWEIYSEKGLSRFLKELLTDHRTKSLLVLLALAIILIIEFFPPKDGYSNNISGDNPLWLCLICTIFTVPVNAFLLSNSWFGIEQLSISTMELSSPEFISSVIFGVIIWIAMICISSKRNLKFLLLPYILFALFSAAVYFSTHHIGFIFLLFLFWFELNSRDKDRFEIGKMLAKRIRASNRDIKAFIVFGNILCFACISVSLFWSASASYNEIIYNYNYGRESAQFIKKYGLEDKRLFSEWSIGVINIDDFNDGNEDFINTYMVDSAIPIVAYFDHNIFYNLNYGRDDQAFVYHRIPTYEVSRKVANDWKSMGEPEVIFGYPNMKYVYGEEFSYKKYDLARFIPYRYIWKNEYAEHWMPIFVKKEILDELLYFKL